MQGRRSAALIVFLLAMLTFGSAKADDRHAGYYYPEPESLEVYQSEVPGLLPGANKQRRVGFVVNLTSNLLDKAYAPPFALFAKGAQRENADRRPAGRRTRHALSSSSPTCESDLDRPVHANLQAAGSLRAQFLRSAENARFQANNHQRRRCLRPPSAGKINEKAAG